jgi:hypothetical protein
MAKLSTLYHQDFSGGLNNTAHKKQINRNEASVLQNWDITKNGQLKRRDGLTKVGNTLSNSIDGLHSYYRPSVGLRDLMTMEGGTLRYLNSTTWDALDNGFTSGKLTWLEDCPLNNKVYISNGFDNLHSWDRSSVILNSCLTDLGVAVPSGLVQRWHKNHMFHLNNVKVSGVTYPHRIYWSEIADPDTYDVANNFFEVPGNGRTISAIDLGNHLLIFKERSLQFLSGWGDTDWRITASSSNVANIDESVGMIAPRGATRVGNEVWFIDDEAIIRRVYQTDFDAFRKDIISTKLQGTLNSINTVQLRKAVASTWNDKVYFAIPTGAATNNSLVAVFDINASKRTGGESWTTYTEWEPTMFGLHIPSNEPILYIGDINGKIYSHQGDDDDGISIPARWDGKEDDLDKPERWKRLKFGYITAPVVSDMSINVRSSVDDGSFADLGNISTIPTGGSLGPTGLFELFPTGPTGKLKGPGSAEYKFYFSHGGGRVRGKTSTLSIRHNEANEQPVINGYTVHFRERDLR